MLQPGLLYYYFSTVADVSANEFNINGSGIFFDNNASFATWYKTLPFNRTLPLFGPRAYRFDDYNEPVIDDCCRSFCVIILHNGGPCFTAKMKPVEISWNLVNDRRHCTDNPPVQENIE